MFKRKETVLSDCKQRFTSQSNLKNYNTNLEKNKNENIIMKMNCHTVFSESRKTHN